MAGETRTALDALRSDPLHRERYDRFTADMVYGERPNFAAAMATLVAAADLWLGAGAACRPELQNARYGKSI